MTLAGLPIDETCYYAVETRGAVLFSGRFHTAPDPQSPRPLVFTVIGDFGVASQPHLDFIRRIEQIAPDFVMTVGDNAYGSGTQAEIDAHWLAPWRGITSQRLVYPALGNHDVLTAHGQPYLDTWVLPHNNPEGTERYYAFDYGMIHGIVLDSNQPGSPAQAAWLRDDLAARRAPWTFVFFHHPPYSGGFHGSNLAVRRAWSALFEAAGVDLVFAGHDHDYERTQWIDEFLVDGREGHDGRGTVYLVTGGGGDVLDEVADCDFNAVGRRAYEMLRVTVDRRRALVEAIGSDGHVLDEVALEHASQ